jgi:hypothetical protein
LLFYEFREKVILCSPRPPPTWKPCCLTQFVFLEYEG